MSTEQDGGEPSWQLCPGTSVLTVSVVPKRLLECFIPSQPPAACLGSSGLSGEEGVTFTQAFLKPR